MRTAADGACHGAYAGVTPGAGFAELDSLRTQLEADEAARAAGSTPDDVDDPEADAAMQAWLDKASGAAAGRRDDGATGSEAALAQLRR
jgi:hypothetical protein